ncbi:hypothetical protein VNO77_03638 [Canavalia gladiata]|uniref:Uncharacterized protein n=1 Tax=Canavalia gladiata TaxID=3824 RepID=A0AAN9N1H4_CANGL
MQKNSRACITSHSNMSSITISTKASKGRRRFRQVRGEMVMLQEEVLGATLLGGKPASCFATLEAKDEKVLHLQT